MFGFGFAASRTVSQMNHAAHRKTGPIMNVVFTIVHWLHLLVAIVGLGAAFYLWFVVHPVMNRLGEEFKNKFLDAAQRRTLMIVLGSVILALITGSINVYRVQFIGPGLKEASVMMVVAKVVLSIGLLLLLVRALAPSYMLKRQQSDSRLYLMLSVAVGLVIIYLSAWVRTEDQYWSATPEVYEETTPDVQRESDVSARLPAPVRDP